MTDETNIPSESSDELKNVEETPVSAKKEMPTRLNALPLPEKEVVAMSTEDMYNMLSNKFNVSKD